MSISDNHNTDRHCERSEAIHVTTKERMDCFVALLLAMTAGHTSASSPRDAPEFCVFLRAPKKQRAQGKPGARCTRSRACSVESTRVSHHRFTGTPGLPCAMVLTVSFVLSRVTGLCCHPRPQEALLLENLTPASGRQDHTTSPSATVPFVWRAIRPPDTAASIASRAQRP